MQPDGSWRVTLSPMCAGAPCVLTAKSGGERRTLFDVAIGEVWLAGG
ncbi:MAG: hypothetical protein LUC50_04085 [Ruminococcus sp.]|nr:hypothetical protein [Ruminococcus sp.]